MLCNNNTGTSPHSAYSPTFSQWEKGENISFRGFNKKTLYPIAKNKNIYYNNNIDKQKEWKHEY